MVDVLIDFSIGMIALGVVVNICFARQQVIALFCLGHVEPFVVDVCVIEYILQFTLRRNKQSIEYRLGALFVYSEENIQYTRVSLDLSVFLRFHSDVVEMLMTYDKDWQVLCRDKGILSIADKPYVLYLRLSTTNSAFLVG